MSQVGPDDLCPCNSGLKYKMCHGSVLTSTEEISSNVPPEASEGRISLTGFPGTYQTMHVLYRFKGDDPRNKLPLEGSPGLYQATFILQRPGHRLMPERDLSFSPGLLGNSHLAISKPAYRPPGNPDADQIMIFGATEDGSFRFTGLPNGKGFLGKLTSDPFQAKNRAHADEIAYRSLAPSLSNISLHLDIPLEIAHREVKELTTGGIQISFVTPFLEVPLAIPGTTTFSTEFGSYAALYREALNANSPAFAFLCLFKIIESLGGRRRRLEREARRNGTRYKPPQEILPSDNSEIKAWLETIFYVRRAFDLATFDSAIPKDLRARSAEDVIERVLKPLRVNIAHALFPEGGELPISSDDLLHTHKVTGRLLFTRCLARRMLKNDFPKDFLAHLPG